MGIEWTHCVTTLWFLSDFKKKRNLIITTHKVIKITKLIIFTSSLLGAARSLGQSDKSTPLIHRSFASQTVMQTQLSLATQKLIFRVLSMKKGFEMAESGRFLFEICGIFFLTGFACQMKKGIHRGNIQANSSAGA